MPFARKRFGQHFLHDPTVIERILAAIDARPGEALCEIGPGRGILTWPLLAAAGELDAIEIDRDLAAELREKHGHPESTRLRLHVADALEFDFAALASARGRALRIVGNLPYNISTPLLFHLLATPASLHDLHLMLQKEVVERIVAAPGDEAYGRLGVMLAPWVEAESLFDIGPGAFRPAPRVWSSVVRLRVRARPAFAVDERFGRIVAAAFGQRRKTLRNSLRALVEPAGMQSCGVDPGARAETLSPAQFGALARLMPSG
jgi:16S rRNA (adenine1518-N6/adenine1519-N6)-dimethyltransferase